MKKLQRRTLFVLLFILALAAGTVVLCAFYVKDGAQWASFYGNQHVYTNGRIASGSIQDRNGTTLFDCAEGQYSDDKTTRISTLHAIGDKQGNINTGAKNLFADQLVGFSLITGTSGTGNTIKLTLDANLNNAAYQAMAGRKGVAALYNYETGEVLCMLSTPSFDPADDAEAAKVAAGDSNYDGAYLNRFLSGTYTPGSTFKLVTAAAALETLHNEDSFSYTCTGSLTLNGEKITCPSVHGTQDFATALANSCNGAFATLATQVGGKTLEKYAKEAGLTSKVNVNGLNTAAGSFTAGTSDNDVGWSGVGQYKDLVNPCAELTLMGCIAQGGSAATPRLLKSVTSSKGLPVAHVTTETSKIGWKADTCDKIRTLMHNNVTSNYSKNLDFGGLNVCAKSGTAEVGTSKPHAWFVGFVEDSAYPYAFVVVVENGGWGSSVAGGVAASLLKAACQ
ncbi:MAG: penicillin-binding transpeptidase domain-containing protein [Eubacteriales bacterium]|nr:penicillin-binding transpeptidase domain-containing protein [Eubacteriales bacterium]